MPQLLRNLFLTIALIPILVCWQPLRADEPVAQPNSLPSGAVARFGTSRFLNFGRAFSVAFSPDGKILAAGGWDGSVRLWEVAGGKELHLFHEQNSPVQALAFSPDGTVFACAGKGSEIVLRETATGKGLRRLAGHQGPITVIAFSPDSKLSASKGHDRTFRLWDVADGRELRRIGSKDSRKEGNNPNCPVAFSRDGRTVTSATTSQNAFPGPQQKTIRVWDVASGAEVRSFPDDSSSNGPYAFSPDNQMLAAVAGYARGLPPRINLWDLTSGKTLPPIELARGESLSILSYLAFSPDGKTLASSGDGPIQLWEVATRRAAAQFPTQNTGANCLAFSPTGRLLVSGSTDTTALLWDVTGRMQNGKLPPATLSPKECQVLWDDLGGPDAVKGRRALWALVAGDGASVAFLKTRLHPVASSTSAEAIAKLVGELNSPEYTVRAKATAQLVQLAELAEPALLESQKHHPSLELRRRVEQLLKAIVDLRTKPTDDRLRAWRAVEVLEQIDTPQARQLLQTLSRGAAGALLTREAEASLARLEGRGS